MDTSSVKTHSVQIKEYASEVGFDLCGIARSRALDEHKPVLKNWVACGFNGDMEYLGTHITKRTDPSILFPGAKSVIITGLNYFPDKTQGGNGIPVLSKYAYGMNYHTVIKGKLNKILAFIKTLYPEATGKTFVDSAPLLEKAWGKEAGLGWPGKNSVLINKEIGSFFFLGALITDIELIYDKPAEEDYCGSCTSCIDSCPTRAINDNRTLDVRKCIAYQTLEAKSQIPEDIVGKLEGRIFGCDRCQDVCPWNKNSKPNRTVEFTLPAEVERMSAEDWKNLNRKDYKRLFKDSAIGRRSYCRFMDNIEAALAGR
jgi:epoxyqueuosine reductase